MPDFSIRGAQLREALENDACDAKLRLNSYLHFALLNPLLSRWRSLYCRFIRPVLAQASGERRLLDIGFGGADIPLRLLRWAQADGFRLRVTSIDRSHKALEFVQTQTWPAEMEFLCCSAEHLLAQGRSYDVVISNHILHELGTGDLPAFLQAAEALAGKLVLFNDIRRSACGYALFEACFGPILRHSFAVSDGLISIRRAYTVAELRPLLPTGWEVRSLVPFRLLLLRRKP